MANFIKWADLIVNMDNVTHIQIDPHLDTSRVNLVGRKTPVKVNTEDLIGLIENLDKESHSA